MRYLITYENDDMVSRFDSIRHSAEESGFFDNIKIFTTLDIDDNFTAQVTPYHQLAKGGGCWLWKPYFIRKALSEIEDGDILIFCDSSCIINVGGKERFEEFMDQLKLSETGTLDFQIPQMEGEYTKQEVLEYFDAPEEVINSNQLMASVVMLRKCPHTVELVDLWFTTARDEPSLFTNELRLYPQRQEFIANNFDQSVFSVIRKTKGTEVIPQNSYFFDFVTECKSFPFWIGDCAKLGQERAGLFF